MIFPQPINLDANASYGVLPEVRARLGECLEGLNPSSIHAGGQRARAAIERARDAVAALLGLRGGERIVFTSGATEANVTAIEAPFGEDRVSRSGAGDGPLWITSALEHHSVLEPCARLGRRGFRGVVITPADGAVHGAEIAAHISPHTRLVTCMAANNEIGHLTPLEEIVRVVRAAAERCVIHSDAVQILGKVKWNPFDAGVDSVSLSAHKIGALSGVGALVVRTGAEPPPLIVGGPQELRYRAGTENVPGIVSFGLAADIVRRTLDERIERMRRGAELLRGELSRLVPEITFNSPREDGLPNTVSVTAPGIRADDVVVALDLAGVYVSSGAACASGKPEPSHVLLARGLPEAAARATLRLSVRADHTTIELEQAAAAIARAITAGRSR